MSGMAPGHSKQRGHGNTILGDFMAKVPSNINYPYVTPDLSSRLHYRPPEVPMISVCLALAVDWSSKCTSYSLRNKLYMVILFTEKSRYFCSQRKPEVYIPFLFQFSRGVCQAKVKTRVLNIFGKGHRCRRLSRHEQRIRLRKRSNTSVIANADGLEWYFKLVLYSGIQN